jgi:hypothetical protein
MLSERIGDTEFKRADSVIAALGRLIERLRQVAAWLQAGEQAKARAELQLIAAEIEDLITELGTEPAALHLPREELITELRLVREEIAGLESSHPSS